MSDATEADESSQCELLLSIGSGKGVKIGRFEGREDALDIRDAIARTSVDTDSNDFWINGVQ